MSASVLVGYATRYGSTRGKRGQVSTFDITPSKDATVDDS